jgi:hypothetical protein
VVTQPTVVLRARQEARGDKSSEKTPGRKLLDDFGVLVGTSRRARGRLVQGMLAHLLPTEEREVQRAARQARGDCEALFRAAAALLDAPGDDDAPTSAAGSLLLTTGSPPPLPREEPTHAR